jgi:hypothetical protein
MYLLTIYSWFSFLSFFPFFSFLYCCTGQGYIEALAKVLTMYQIYHTWIHPLHHSLSSPLPNSQNSFNNSHFSTYIHVYLHYIHTVCILLPHFPITSALTSANLPPQNVFCSPILWFCRRKKIKDEKKNMAFLLVWHKDDFKRSFRAYMYYNPNWFIST